MNADVLTPQQRQLNMSRIRARDTRPEMAVRRGLHALGLRYRLHDRTLPGSPDLVFPRYRTAVFVHGCFWHVHGCAMSKWPATRPEFWQKKLGANAARDRRVLASLQTAGWRVLVIWECSLRGTGRRASGEVIAMADRFIRDSDEPLLEIGTAAA
jgi:DNA mismatch endonuclease (patch repair protein)